MKKRDDIACGRGDKADVDETKRKMEYTMDPLSRKDAMALLTS